MVQENNRSQRLARLVKRLRGNASTYVFGAQLGVTHSTIRRWESGQGGINEEGVEKLSDGTGISADTIRAYLRGGLSLRVCLGLDEASQSGAQSVIERLPTLSTQELLTVLESTASQLQRRLPSIRPEVSQILRAAITLLGVPLSPKRGQKAATPETVSEQFLPRSIQDAIVDEIEARYGSLDSMNIARFAQEVGIQPSDRLIEIVQGKNLEQSDLMLLQPHLHKYVNQCWTLEELDRLKNNAHQS